MERKIMECKIMECKIMAILVLLFIPSVSACNNAHDPPRFNTNDGGGILCPGITEFDLGRDYMGFSLILEVESSFSVSIQQNNKEIASCSENISCKLDVFIDPNINVKLVINRDIRTNYYNARVLKFTVLKFSKSWFELIAELYLIFVFIIMIIIAHIVATFVSKVVHIFCTWLGQ